MRISLKNEISFLDFLGYFIYDYDIYTYDDELIIYDDKNKEVGKVFCTEVDGENGKHYVINLEPYDNTNSFDNVLIRVQEKLINMVKV